ncbi:MAG: anti-sigma factor [Pseudomonadota bacterium]
MSTTDDRLYELLVQRTHRDLSTQERAELAELLALAGGATEAEVDLAIAAAWQTFGLRETPIEPAPTELRDRLAADASAFFDSATVTPITRAAKTAAAGPQQQTGSALLYRFGWAAAALLAIALLFSVRTEMEQVAPAPDPAALRAALLRDAADAVQLAWAVPELEGYENVRGDVVWSDRRQEGYLLLSGLPVNDPAKSQYQLWIVDPNRDANPVDGGVFDVSDAAGQTVVAIDAKLAVAIPAAFAITREQPGGVVVSKGPLLVVASAT